MSSAKLARDPANLRVDEYSTAQGRVFSIYLAGRHFKRFTSKGETASPTWVKQGLSGESSLVSPENEKRLEEIHSRPSRYQTVRRFPRTNTDVPLCLEKAQRAYRHGRIEQTLYLLEKARHAISPAQLKDTQQEALTWENVPRFDPALVSRTKWVVGSFLVEGNIQLVFGERGSFKSTLFLALARAVSKGKSFLGMKTRRRRVLYLDYENPANVISARNTDLRLGLPSSDLIVWDRFGHGTPPKPGEQRLEHFVKDCVATTGHGPWLIFDSWSSLLGPAEGGELTSQTAYKFVELRRLADLGATITVIDHTRKYDRSTVYGGQDKEAKVDSIHNLLLYDDHRAYPVVLVRSWLKRNAPRNEGNFAFEVRGGQDRNGQWHIRKIVRAEDPEIEEAHRHTESLKKIIRDNPRAGQEEIAKLATDQGLARDEAIKLLKSGCGKYWTYQRQARGKFQYTLR